MLSSTCHERSPPVQGESDPSWQVAAGYRVINTAKTVVGALQKRPAKAGGRSPKGPAVAGTTVVCSAFELLNTGVPWLLQLLDGVQVEEMDAGSEVDSEDDDDDLEMSTKSTKKTMSYKRFDKDDPLLAESGEEDDDDMMESDEDLEMESEWVLFFFLLWLWSCFRLISQCELWLDLGLSPHRGA